MSMKICILSVFICYVICDSPRSLDIPDFESVEIIPESLDDDGDRLRNPQLVPVTNAGNNGGLQGRCFVVSAAITAFILFGGIFTGFFFLIIKFLR